MIVNQNKVMELKNYKITLENPWTECSKKFGEVNKLSEAIAVIEDWCQKNNMFVMPKSFDHNLMHGSRSYWFMTVVCFDNEDGNGSAHNARFTIYPAFLKIR